MILGINGIIAGKAGFDLDAQAFITAASITDLTQQNAINQLVLDLKNANIWTKMKAVYPFVGGTASSHKWNLKDPRDLDAAYRLTFGGGWTHSATGAKPNGTTAFANTYLTPNTNLTQWNTHLSYYSRTSTRITNTIEIGSYDGTSSNLFSLILPRSNGLSTSTMYSQALTTDEARTTTATDASGFFIGTRTSNTANTHKLFRNGAVIGTASTSAGTLLSNPLYIGAMRTGASAGAYSNKESAFASIGDGLSDSEATALYNAVNAYQVALSRNV